MNGYRFRAKWRTRSRGVEVERVDGGATLRAVRLGVGVRRQARVGVAEHFLPYTERHALVIEFGAVVECPETEAAFLSFLTAVSAPAYALRARSGS